eukprot:203655_1
MRPHRLVFVSCLHVLYLYTYLPQLSLTACIYNETYVYVNTANYPQYDGLYLRNLARGILTVNPDIPFLPPNCGQVDTDYDGTYIYETESEPKHYLWMKHNGFNGNVLQIGDTICDPQHVKFETIKEQSSLLLDGTHCVWSSIDSENGIQWQDTDTYEDVTGSFLLCDFNEGCDTPLPTPYPTQSPVTTTAVPTENPTTAFPTTPPTVPSMQPTKTRFLEPPCVALTVRYLDQAYPDQAAHEEQFNEIPDVVYNQRRIWRNGGNRLEIFYTNQYEPNRWVISNGTYDLINDPLVDGGVNQSFPVCIQESVTQCMLTFLMMTRISLQESVTHCNLHVKAKAHTVHVSPVYRPHQNLHYLLPIHRL